MRDDFLKYHAQTTQHSMAFDVDYAKGNYIYGKDGKAYLDFAAGVSANTLGHAHPKILKAIHDQVDKHLHVMVYGEYIQDSPLKLVKLLAEVTPAPLESTYLVNSGAEAIDGALKLAKRATGRSQIVSAKMSYHGNTHGALSVSGNESFKKAFRPLLPDIYFIEFNNWKDIKKITSNTAAVILETIQGAAGFILPKNGWLKAIKEQCKKVGALLILDEIQPGFGRTGKIFAFEHFGIVPDILVMGKGMGGGMPIGAFMSSYLLMQNLQANPQLGHITTFGGNAVVASSALAVLEEITTTSIIKDTLTKELTFRKLLVHPKIKSVQGKGLMIAVELDSPEVTIAVAKECMNQGLIVFWLLYETQFLRITPPLTISKDEIIKGCNIILKVLNSL